MFATAWDVAQNSIGEAQERYKRQYDKGERPPKFRVGDGVLVERQMGRRGKLASPFEGPYRVKAMEGNTVEVQPVAKPDAAAERLNVSRIRECP